MQEILDLNPVINVLDSEYNRLLGYPKDHYIDKRALELIQMTRNWYAENGKPWIYVRSSERFEILEDSFKIDGIEFKSAYLLNQFKRARADRVILAAVSAGTECEKQAQHLWLEHKPDEYFFMEMYGSAAVEHLIAATGARLCAWADQHHWAVLPHYSPGYSGWDISAQNTLMALIEQSVNVKFPEELTVMETGMLLPKKSLLAVFGITKEVHLTERLDKLIPCENCALPDCSFRRTEFKFSLRLMEDVSKLQPQTSTQPRKEKNLLNTKAIYATHINALKKWTETRLELVENSDGTVTARFRFEGSTCSNLGFPLVYDYEVHLDSGENNYTILDMSCTPAPGHEGYSKMCAYIKNPQRLTAVIGKEKPLLGQPINDILDWKRMFKPSGCYCDQSSRFHKWGMVLETIHYALVQKTSEKDKRTMQV